MKLVIASDIHGSAYYCRQLLDAIHQEQADRLILLGDILYHGPRNDLPQEYAPKAVIAMLNDLQIPVYGVRGNCDADIDQVVLHFPILAESCLMPVGEHMIFATHGHLYNKDKLPPLSPGDILLHGHTHVPAWEACGSVTYCNPGSVSIPKEGSAHSYMTLDGNRLSWKDLTGCSYHEMTLTK